MKSNSTSGVQILAQSSGGASVVFSSQRRFYLLGFKTFCLFSWWCARGLSNFSQNSLKSKLVPVGADGTRGADGEKCVAVNDDGDGTAVSKVRKVFDINQNGPRDTLG